MAESTRSRIINPTDIKWNDAMPDAPMGTIPGVRMKVLWSDPPTKRTALMIRFEPGASPPMHRHIGDEILYVIEGSIEDDAGAVTAGNLGYRPNGCSHQVKSRNGATVLAVITGDVAPSKEIGNTPRSQVIALSEVPWHDGIAGVRQKRIWEDKAANRHVALARFEPGASLPRHRHTGEELLYIVEGSHADESGEVTAGNLSLRPNGCEHAVNSRNGATTLAFLWGGIEMM
jgi:anti-sigma factor ChrR (cupin superfamily)